MKRLAIGTSVLMVLSFVPVILAAAPAQASCSTAGCAAPVPCNTSVGACWKPATNARWQYQLSAAKDKRGNCLFTSTGGINVNITGTPFTGGAAVAPSVFDIDFQTDGACTGGTITQENSAAVAAIHARGAKAICYIDAGGAETFRPDFPQYDAFNTGCGGCLFGKPVGGFRDEFWLNINTGVSGTNPATGQTETAQQFILDELAARLAKARSAGVDAIEFDNVDAYQNKTGLTISAATQEQFDAAIANLAHTAGFAAGLKNDLGQAGDLQPYFDFAINEQCWQYRECNFPAPGLQAWPSTDGKAVFNVEYKLATSKFCPQANSSSYNFNSILKDVNLYDVPYTPCR